MINEVADARRRIRRGLPSRADIEHVRRQVRLAFQALRRRGFLARMSFQCCAGCAEAELVSMMERRGDNPYYVFFHKQDSESFNRYGELHIRYGRGVGGSVEDTRRSGHIIKEELEKRGLRVNWNGDVSKTIQVKV